MDAWLPVVRRLRLGTRWEDVARVLQATGGGPALTAKQLRNRVRLLAREGLVEAGLLGRAVAREGAEDRLAAIVGALKRAAPDRSLRWIAGQLEAMRERSPRGGLRWHASSVRQVLEHAHRLGYYDPQATPDTPPRTPTRM